MIPLLVLILAIVPGQFRQGSPGYAAKVSDYELLEVNVLSEHEKSGVQEGVEGTVEGVKGKAKEAAGSVLGKSGGRR